MTSATILGLCQESQNQNQCGSKGESKSRRKLVYPLKLKYKVSLDLSFANFYFTRI